MNIRFNINIRGMRTKNMKLLQNALYSLGYRLMSEDFQFDDTYVEVYDGKNVMPLVFLDYQSDLEFLSREVDEIVQGFNTTVIDMEQY